MFKQEGWQVYYLWWHMCPVCNCHILVKIHDNFLKRWSSVLPWAGRYILTFPVPISVMIWPLLHIVLHSKFPFLPLVPIPDLWTVEQRYSGAVALGTPLCGKIWVNKSLQACFACFIIFNTTLFFAKRVRTFYPSYMGQTMRCRLHKVAWEKNGL